MVAGNLAGAGRAVKEGRADAACIPIGNASVEELQAAWGARFLSSDISEAGLARARKYMPTASGMLIQPGATGVKVPTGFLAMQYDLVVSKDLPDDVVLAVLKALDNYFDDYKGAHPLMRTWNPENAITPLIPAPVHPAAVKYYKSKHLWTSAVAARDQELLKFTK